MWGINPILGERSAVGTFLKALFGYNGNPSLLEVIAYGVYFVGVAALLLLFLLAPVLAPVVRRTHYTRQTAGAETGQIPLVAE